MEKVLLKYKQREIKPWLYEERFGQKTFIPQEGFIDYDQEEELELSEVVKRIAVLKSYTNRNYHSFNWKIIS
jgi:hypothetical protein